MKTLSAWLAAFKQWHPRHIDLGLERCQAVALKLDLLRLNIPIISVAGTNGKGSSVAYLDNIYRAAGYRTGCYNTPHLRDYNERIRINGAVVTEDALCQAFERINCTRGAVSLSEFEFGTLAAVLLFQQAQVDVMLLEVGLGGRLDAVNVWDADCALITKIGIDHCEYLGDTREQIAVEKAGIMRPQRPAVCADPQPPHTLLDYAGQQQVQLACLAEKADKWLEDYQPFSYQKTAQSWAWRNTQHKYSELPLLSPDTDYAYQNAAGVLQVIDFMQAHLPVPLSAMQTGLQTMRLNGRFQKLDTLPVPCILDVAHNPLGAKALREALAQEPCAGKTHALLGMMQDKDIAGTLTELRACFDVWHLVDLPQERAAQAVTLQAHLQLLGIQSSHIYESVARAYKALSQTWQAEDCLLVFGSFHTVAAMLDVAEAYEEKT